MGNILKNLQQYTDKKKLKKRTIKSLIVQLFYGNFLELVVYAYNINKFFHVFGFQFIAAKAARVICVIDKEIYFFVEFVKCTEKEYREIKVIKDDH